MRKKNYLASWLAKTTDGANLRLNACYWRQTPFAEKEEAWKFLDKKDRKIETKL